MAGNVSTLRVSGLPSGYPAEIDANIKIRWVDNLLVNMSENSAGLLRYIGGPSSFEFTNPKVEWVEDDQWGRRPTHTGLINAGDTSWVVTGQAHRYPVGTLFLHVPSAEVVRVSAHADADTLTLIRDVPGTVAEGAWDSDDEVIVIGHAMNEDDNWTFRPSAILTMPFNYAQVSHEAVQITYRRMSTAFYGLTGTDLDYQVAGATAFHFVALDQQILAPYRFEGASASRPALTGGLDFYITEANGAQVTDLNSSADLVRGDIDDILQELWYSVGPERMARTILGSGWAQRRVDSFWQQSERLPAGFAGVPGVHIQSFRTAFGVIDVLMHTEVPKNKLYLLNRDQVKMGHFAGLGRPHLLALAAPSATGPRVQRAYYSDTANKIKGVQSMAIITEFNAP